MDSKREAIARIVEDFPGGKEAAAAVLGMNVTKFNNHQYECKGTRPLDEGQIFHLEQVAGTSHYADYIAKMYGGVFVQKQNEEDIDHVAIESMLMELCASYGQLHITVSEATSDGVISQKEENQINARRDQHIATLHKYLDGQISLHRRERKK